MEKEHIKEAADKAKEFSEELKEKARIFLQDFDAEEQMENMKDSVADLADTTAKFVRKYPIQSVLGAAAIGFVVSGLLRRR
jgi:ElaB/YqjD/DUF883 family membrane-anchored ribosome-binding protein